jgi:dTDP-4-dehydrorhamnose 3,5-epimerase
MTKAYFEFFTTTIKGLMVIQRKPIEDERGFFCRFYCADEFRNAGLNKPIAQINHTLTREKGTVRGLHFQYPPHAESKIVSCTKGEVFDVAVDIRRGSSTFLKWHFVILSAVNHKSLLIPQGFAHGFQTLCNECELIYLHTASYAPEAEGGLNIRDSSLAIEWPLYISHLSKRDMNYPYIDDQFNGVKI